MTGVPKLNSSIDYCDFFVSSSRLAMSTGVVLRSRNFTVLFCVVSLCRFRVSRARDLAAW